MCTDKEFERIKENNGDASKQMTNDIQDAKEDIKKENKQADERLRSMLF